MPPPLPVWWNITNAFPTIGTTLPLAASKVNPTYSRWNFGAPSLAVGPPSLATQPTNFIVNAGSAATFSVQATGTPVAVFQWFKGRHPCSLVKPAATRQRRIASACAA